MRVAAWLAGTLVSVALIRAGHAYGVWAVFTAAFAIWLPLWAFNRWIAR
jgi:hypothetical protein